LDASPYVCGDPITPNRADVFVGREEKIDQIRRQIASTGNVVLLEGNRRAGKTSILKHLEGVNGVPGWLGVYASLQGAEGSKGGVGVPTDEIFRTLAREIAKAVHALGDETPLPDGSLLAAGSRPMTLPKACRIGISTEAPFTDFQAYIEVILDVLAKRDLGLLVMLDEFDKLQDGINNGVTSPQVPENIRYLVQTYPRCSAILTGSRRLKRLREEYWSALYGLGTRIGVTALAPAAAERLITEPVKGKLTYSTEAIRRVIELTAGQPYLLQCLCNRIYDTAAQQASRSITVDQVEKGALALIEDNEHFASLWNYAGGDDHPHRRRYLLCICHREGRGPDPLRLGVIQERLLADGIEAEDEAIAADLEHLRELELIDMIGDGISARYQLSIPLMGIWIDRQRDIAAALAAALAESEDHDG
jgi:type I restriction enzyme M protein